jgi:hypothetical protein
MVDGTANDVGEASCKAWANTMLTRSQNSRHTFLTFFIASLLLQTAATIGAILFLHLSISTGWDEQDYLRTADNVVAAHGFSIDNSPPFRPNGFRTPGSLLLDIPLRILSFKNDIAAVLISRLVVLLGGFLCVIIAADFGVDHKYALLAGPLFVLSPSMFYYSMLAYNTELPYSVVCGMLAVGTLRYLGQANRAFGILIGMSALYALYLRPASLLVLLAYVGSCVLLAVVTSKGLRRRALIAAGTCLLATSIAYVTWSYRNYVVFHSFDYSTVSENLLQWNARAMEPFLDGQGQKELSESLKKYPFSLQRYSGADQFAISDEERKAGLRLIFKYPKAFLQSHLLGTIEATFLFRPKSLDPEVVARRGWHEQYRVESASSSKPLISRRSVLQTALATAMSSAHLGYLLIGTFGLILLYPTLNVSQRGALLILVFIGIISVVTGGAVRSPRFRIPLDIPFIVGIANCISCVRKPTGARERLRLRLTNDVASRMLTVRRTD